MQSKNTFYLYISAAILTYFILDKVGHRELCVTGGVLSGLGYIFCGFYMDEIWQIFLGFSMSGKSQVALRYTVRITILILENKWHNDPHCHWLHLTYAYHGVMLAYLRFIMQNYYSKDCRLTIQSRLNV